jgi:hypothetical protein
MRKMRNLIQEKIEREIKKLNSFYQEKINDSNRMEIVARIQSNLHSVKDILDIQDIAKEILEEY